MNNYNQLRNTENDSPFYFYSIYKNGAHHKSLIPYDPKKNEALLKLGSSLPFHPASQTEDPKSFYFSTPLENIVYQVTKDTAIKLFQFILPASYQINNSLLKINKKEQLDSIIQSRSWFKDNTVLAITNISIRDGRVFFQTITGGQNLYDANGTIINRNFIYELKNGKLSSFEHLTPDKSSCFLPFWHLKPAGNLNVISSRGYLYSSLPSLIMFAEKDRNKFRNPQYPVVLQRYFKDQDRKSNPVIVKIKPK